MLYFLRLSTLSDFNILMKSMIDHIINNNPKIYGKTLKQKESVSAGTSMKIHFEYATNPSVTVFTIAYIAGW